MWPLAVQKMYEVASPGKCICNEQASRPTAFHVLFEPQRRFRVGGALTGHVSKQTLNAMQLAIELDETLVCHAKAETEDVMCHEETLGGKRVRRLQFGRRGIAVRRNHARVFQV